MSYKIQNRSPASKRLKFIKRTDGQVSFVGSPVPTYQENTIQAGWCMAAISPLPELTDPQTTFELSAAPMGTDGRVSLYRNGTLVSSMRYNALNSNAAKVKWFNDFFGAVVLMAIVQGITVFTIREDDTVITLVFEDDDIDYVSNNLSPASPNRTAFFREQYRLAVGLKLTEIDCTGAIDWAGILTFNDQVEGTVNNSSGTTGFIDTDGMVAGLEGKGFTVIPLNDWIPRPPAEFHPRLSLRIVTDPEVEVPVQPEPTDIVVEIKPKGSSAKVYSGKISDVMDNCRKHGILLRFKDGQFQIGTEPKTPFTTVKVTAPSLVLEFNDPDDWWYSNWQNSTAVLSTNKHNVVGNFGWDDLPEFWCFMNNPWIDGATGTVGDTVNFANFDYTVKGTIADTDRKVTVNTDFTETCKWNTNHPELCRQLHQIDEAIEVINTRFAGRGGKFFDFNQNPVWGPPPSRSVMCVESDYYPTALRWMPESDFGYSIPEPEMPM